MPIHPFVAATKNLPHAEKQRVLSRISGLQDSQLCYVTAALATVGWKWGCQPFSCRCSQNVTHCRKEIWATYLFKASIPATPFGNSNHKLPPRSRFLRATVHSALWFHDAHPFNEAQKICLMQRSRRSCHGFVVSKICYKCSDCALSCST